MTQKRRNADVLKKAMSDRFAPIGKKKSVVTLLCLVIFIVFVSLFTPIYNVSEIIVEGNSAVSYETAAAASGIKIGENIFKVNLREARDRLSKVAFVSEVDVVRRLPDKIKITISESEECAYISFVGNYIGIDESGKILEMRQDLSGAGKPIVFGLKIDSFEIGSYIFTDDNKKKRLLFEMLAQIKESGISDKIYSVDISDGDSILMMLNGGTAVKLGSEDNIKYKIAYLKSVIEELGDVTGGVIDISDTENVIYRAQ